MVMRNYKSENVSFVNNISHEIIRKQNKKKTIKITAKY